MRRWFSRLDHWAGRWFFRGVGMLFLFAAIMCFTHGCNQIGVSIHARSWPSTPGTITSSRVQGGGPAIEYQYEVGGKEYHNHMIHVGQVTGLEGYARRLVNRYPAGAATRVYHDPAVPERSILEHRVPWTSFLLSGMGAGFLFGFWICWRQRRSFSEILVRSLNDEAC